MCVIIVNTYLKIELSRWRRGRRVRRRKVDSRGLRKRSDKISAWKNDAVKLAARARDAFRIVKRKPRCETPRITTSASKIDRSWSSSRETKANKLIQGSFLPVHNSVCRL